MLLHLLTALTVAQPSRTPLTPGSWAITNVNVVPMSRDTVIRSATVVIRDGRIASITTGPMQLPAASVRTVDGTGKYLIPGLADVHTHLYADSELPDSVGKYEVGVILANGVTTARLMIGELAHIALRKDIQEGRVVGPQLWLASPQLAGRPDANAIVVTTPERARAAVKESAEAGYDFIKITNFITSLAVYDALMDEARIRRIPVDGHIEPAIGVARALSQKQNVQHLDSYLEAVLADSAPMKESLTQGRVFQLRNWPSVDYFDDKKIAAIAGATARAGIRMTPTLTVFNTAFAIGQTDSAIRARPEWELMPESVKNLYLRANVRYWTDSMRAVRTDWRAKRYVEVRNKLAKAIADSGGIILAGSDSPDWFLGYGTTLHRELEWLVKAGFTPYKALLTATRNPAEYFGAAAEWGTIETGKRADLVLLSANPLTDIRNTTKIDGVSIGGRWLEPAELKRMYLTAREKLQASDPGRRQR